MIELKACTHRIGQKTLVGRLNLRLEAGKLIAIVGPNGAGKSSLLNLIAGIHKPTEGKVYLNNTSLEAFGQKELARKRAYLSQRTHVGLPFSVEEVVMMGRYCHNDGLATKADDRLLENALAKVGMSAYRHRPVLSLSGGEQQRVHMARVLVQAGEDIAGKAVLMDEPMNNLDVQHRQNVIGIAKKLAHGGALVLMVLHDLNLAANHSDRIIWMKKGFVEADGKPGETLSEGLLETLYNIRFSLERTHSGYLMALPKKNYPIVKQNR